MSTTWTIIYFVSVFIHYCVSKHSIRFWAKQCCVKSQVWCASYSFSFLIPMKINMYPLNNKSISPNTSGECAALEKHWAWCSLKHLPAPVFSGVRIQVHLSYYYLGDMQAGAGYREKQRNPLGAGSTWKTSGNLEEKKCVYFWEEGGCLRLGVYVQRI